MYVYLKHLCCTLAETMISVVGWMMVSAVSGHYESAQSQKRFAAFDFATDERVSVNGARC